MKKLEILDKGNTRFVLTVTPSRITIKLQEGSSELDRERVIKFFKWVSERPELDDQLFTFRGRTDIPPTNIPLMIQMVNSNNKIKFTYRETQME
jgi:hypothetical protein